MKRIMQNRFFWLFLVVMFALPGSTRLAPLVSVSAPVKRTTASAPCESVIPVTAVVPVTSTRLPVAASRFRLAAEAMFAPWASFRRAPLMASRAAKLAWALNWVAALKVWAAVQVPAWL